MLILTTEYIQPLTKPQTGCGCNRIYASFSALALEWPSFPVRVNPAPWHWRNHRQGAEVIVSALTLVIVTSGLTQPTPRTRTESWRWGQFCHTLQTKPQTKPQTHKKPTWNNDSAQAVGRAEWKFRPVTVSRPRHYTVHQEIGSLGPKDQLWFSCLYPFW